VDEVRIPPAGDGFYAAAKHRPNEDHAERGCPACFGGYVTFTVEEDGEEHDEAVPCRRCGLRGVGS
jgi:hypothetical protein